MIEHSKARTVVVLVFLFMLINYADKAVIGLSSVPIMQDLHLSHAQFGLLGSSFFLLFSISGIVVGFLANRFSTKAIMWIMSIVWASAVLPMSWLSNFPVLLGSRVVLGAAEGPAFPVAVHAVYKWFGNERRAVPTSVVACGAAFGTGIVAPLITWIIANYSWHAAFGTLAVVGLIWASFWLALGEEGPIANSTVEGIGALQPLPYRQLLCSRTAMGVYLAGFAAYWVIALNIVWLANYLIKALHMPPAQAAWIIALPSVMQLLLAPICAYLSQRLTLRGYSSRISRGLFGASCVILSGVSMQALAVVGMGALKVLLIGIAFSVGSVIFTLGSTLIGEISPVSQRGAMLGITNSIHTLAGLCAPIVMGIIADTNQQAIGGFRTGYLYAGALVVILGVLAAVLINPEADLARFRRIVVADPAMAGNPAA